MQTPGPEAELNNQAASDLHEEKDDTKVAGLSLPAQDEPEASGEAPEHEAQKEDEEQQQLQQQEVPVRQRQTENEVSEVEIPNVGRIMVRADADGYNEEVSMCHNETMYSIFRLLDIFPRCIS